MADQLSDMMKNQSRGPVTNQAAALQIKNLTEMVLRSRLATQLGLSFDGNRDLYEALGHKKDLTFDDYWNMYKRGSLGKRVINAPVESTWRKGVQVLEDDTPKTTAFEEAWEKLNDRLKVLNKLTRLDKLVGLGDYAVLLLGFNDGKPLSEPLDGSALDLLYIQPYHQNNAYIEAWEEDTTNERYGLPKIYKLKMSRPYNAAAKEERVHFSRILHVAEGVLENDVVGTPRMESVYNRIEDLQKLAGGSAEMFWQGALGGKAFSAKDGATVDVQALSAIQDEIDEYLHGMRRYMRLTNMDVQDLSPQVSDPNPHIEAQIKLISGDTRIPQRILVGSERGELASTQDESNWLSCVQERRDQFAEPCILRPFIDILIERGTLPKPADTYQIKWPDLWSASEKEQADVAKTKTEALAAYINAPGADAVVPVEFFLEEFLHVTPDQIDRIKTMLQALGYSLQPTKEEEEEEAEAMRRQMEGAGGGTGEEEEEGGGAPPEEE